MIWGKTLRMERNDGRKLESEVAALVESMLASGQLPYRKELVKFRAKAQYYSNTRKGDVDFENVIEVYVNDNVDQVNAQPTHVIFFECKDHGRNVEVGKVEEVVGRLNGSFGFNMKAYIVTRKGFATGALQTAKSHGIGLIKIMPESKIQFYAHMMTSDTIEQSRREFPRRASAALTNPNYVSDGESFYAMDNGYVFPTLEGVIGKYLRDSSGGQNSD
jgi:hypothetical protein